MGLLAKLVMLPVAPAAGVVWLAEQIRREAEAQLAGPAGLRARLAELDERASRGEISEEERRALEEELLAELDDTVSTRAGPASDRGTPDAG